MTRRRWLIDVGLIAAGVLSVLFEPYSIAMHSIIGLVFFAIVGPHLWHRRTWIRGIFRRLRQQRRLAPKLRWSLLQSCFLLALAVFVTVSGLYDWLDPETRIPGHGLAGVILIAVAARHVWTRRKWLRRRQPGSSGWPGAGQDARPRTRAPRAGV